MKNPFASDRNIFSQISKPSFNKFQKPKDSQTSQVNVTAKQPSKINPPSNHPYHQEYAPQHKIQPQYEDQKMTFGVAKSNEQKDFILDRPSRANYQLEKFSSQISSSNPQNRVSFDSSSDFVVSKQWQANEQKQEKPQLVMSPITEKSKHQMDEEQFINLDALSNDISKLLASQKNQEEICKLLGIEKDKERMAQSSNLYSKESLGASNKFETPRQHQFEMKPVPVQYRYEPQRNQKRQEESLPVFGERPSTEVNNLQVFEYEKGTEEKGWKGLDLEEMLEIEMRKLYKDGNSRIFLSGGDRVVTVRYDLQQI